MRPGGTPPAVQSSAPLAASRSSHQAGGDTPGGRRRAALVAAYRQLSPTVPQTRLGRWVPTLIIVGSRDPFSTEDTAYARGLGRGQATLVVLRGAGHGIDSGASAATQQLWSAVVGYLAAHHLASAG